MKHFLVTGHGEMECELLGVARLKLKVGLKQFAEDVDEEGQRGSISMEKPNYIEYLRGPFQL